MRRSKERGYPIKGGREGDPLLNTTKNKVLLSTLTPQVLHQTQHAWLGDISSSKKIDDQNATSVRSIKSVLIS